MKERSKLISVVNTTKTDRLGDVIFVHGINADPRKTWMTDNQLEGFPEESWLYWLGEDIPDIAVWTLGYPANAFGWQGFTMELKDRADNITNLLLTHPNLAKNRPIIFVTHSMGGLLVKHMLRRALSGDYPNAESLVEQTKGIVFLSTPHRGANLANFIEYLASRLTNVNVQELKKDEPTLLDLNNWFCLNFNRLDLSVEVFFEQYPTSLGKDFLMRWIRKIVVDKDSATLALPNVRMTGLDADHSSICWVNSYQFRNTDQLYSNVVTFIQKCLQISLNPEIIPPNYPVKIQKQPSSVRLIPSREKMDKQLPLLIYEPEEMPKVWGVEPQNIWLHEGRTLASLKPGQFAHFKKRCEREVNFVKKDDLFCPELYFIELEDGLPGGLLPDKKESDIIRFNNKPVTPLIPLNSMLLDYFTPEELVKRITFKMQNAGQVRVILDLPLSGVKQKQQSYLLYKDYELKGENCLGEQLPVVQIWPNFCAKGWQEYYTFYYDSELGAKAFQISIPNAKDSHRFKAIFGQYQLAKSETFPEFFLCSDSHENPIGIILMKSPNEIPKNRDWKVGVDVGTSFTNIFIKLKNTTEPLPLKNLQRQITKAEPSITSNALFEFFIPENFIPQHKPLPIFTILTTNGENINHYSKLPIFDGRIYIPNYTNFRYQEPYIKTNLKWQKGNPEHSQLFIGHLALHICALAAESGVQSIQWAISYPSAFSRLERKRYVHSWRRILTDLQETTGIIHKILDIKSEYLKTESLAFAQYFADYERQDLVYTTCIDIGGGTSDISIWDSRKIVHQCSVFFAGRNLFSEIIQNKPSFIQKRLKDTSESWEYLNASSFNTKLDIWLRLNSEDWLKKERAIIADEEDMKGLVTVMAIGIAGLYYYVGILLKVLKEEGKHSREEITPVYIGGNGSRFLHWLDDQGDFSSASEINQILGRMLSTASEFPDSKIETILTNKLNPKDEVACGLVLEDTKLEGMDIREDDPLIAGEACLITYSIDQKNIENEITANFRIKVDDELVVKDFKIPELVELPKFLCEFHKVLKELDIEEISALKDYKPSPDIKDNPELWDKTKRALNGILLNIKGQPEEIRFEPPFILGLKALLRVLGREWGDR